MHGLESIRAINDHAVLKYEDEQRRLNGYKPASIVGEVLRKNLGKARPAGKHITVLMQGKSVCVK